MKLQSLSEARPTEVPRDGLKRPLVVPAGGGKPVALTRTTTFVDCIEDKSSITDWKMRGVLIGCAKVPMVLDEVRGLDPNEDKQRLNKLAENAFELSGFNAKRDKGTQLHKLSEFVDAARPIPGQQSAEDMRDMAAYTLMTADLEVTRVEQFVVVDELGVGGTLDRTVRYSGLGPDGVGNVEGEYVGDVKTGSVEYGGLKMAGQVGIYARGQMYDHTVYPVDERDKKAIEAWKKIIHEDLGAYSPMVGINQDWGIIIHLPSGKAAGGLYWVDLKLGWEAALLAKEIRAIRSKSKKALTPFTRS